VEPLALPPPPEPPASPNLIVGLGFPSLYEPPPPPPTEVIELITEFDPTPPLTLPAAEPVPPAPTVTEVCPAVTDRPVAVR
jgi:hypothetical protein